MKIIIDDSNEGWNAFVDALTEHQWVALRIETKSGTPLEYDFYRCVSPACGDENLILEEVGGDAVIYFSNDEISIKDRAAAVDYLCDFYKENKERLIKKLDKQVVSRLKYEEKLLAKRKNELTNWMKKVLKARNKRNPFIKERGRIPYYEFFNDEPIGKFQSPEEAIKEAIKLGIDVPEELKVLISNLVLTPKEKARQNKSNKLTALASEVGQPRLKSEFKNENALCGAFEHEDKTIKEIDRLLGR